MLISVNLFKWFCRKNQIIPRGYLYIPECDAKEPGTSQLDHYILLHGRMCPQAISQNNIIISSKLYGSNLLWPSSCHLL